MRSVYGVLSTLALLALLLACSNPQRGEQDQTGPEAANAPARISGQVLLQGQDSSGGVQVYIPGTSLIAFSDNAGRFAMKDVPAGRHEVMARAEGFAQAALGPVTVEPGQQYNLQPVTLVSKSPAPTPTPAQQELGSLRGTVALAGQTTGTAAGVDWSRCAVALEKTPYRTTCAPDGTFLLWNLPPDQYVLTARMEGFEPVSTNVRVLPGPEPTTAELRLARAVPATTGDRAIRGGVQLIGPTGQPATDYDKIIVQLANLPGQIARPNAQGAFALTGLAPGRYTVTATGQGYQPPTPVDVDLTSLPEIEITLTMNAAATTTNTTARLRGVAVKNVEGETDMSGINVALAGTALIATTDAAGRYEIPNVPPGSYTMIAQADGFETAQQGPIELEAGQTLEAEGLLLEPELDRPVVLETTPANGARNVLIRREIPITIRFSKKMQPESLRQAVRIDPPVAFRVFVGREQPDLDFDLVRVVLAGAIDQPVARFRTRYTLTISDQASDFEGLTLEEPFSMSFTTGNPAVVTTIPANNERSAGVLSPASPVAIYFNAAMDYTTLNIEAISLRPALQQLPNLSIQDDPVTGWTRLYISAIWQPDTEYRITVNRRPRTVGQDALENTPYTFRFRTSRLYLPPFPQAPRNPR